MRQPKSVKALEDLGRVRLSANFFLRDFLYSEIAVINGFANIPDDPDLAIAAGKRLCESLVASSELFGAKPFFLSDEFSLADCTVLPILWRLERWGVTLPPAADRLIAKYTNRMFRRDPFRASLTESEREMRAG